MTLRLLTLFALLSLPTSGLAQEYVSDVKKEIQTAMKKQGIPGLSVAIVIDNKIDYTGGFGFSDIENRVRAKPETIYRLASISKPITAIAVMQLVDAGKIDLDAPVQKYVPGFPEKKWPLTTRHLLSHLGGVRHYKRPGEINSTKHYPKLKEALEQFADDPLIFEPGTQYKYTTYGYNLLGCVVEAASGESFPDYLKKTIFTPAKMETAQTDNLYRIIPNRAQGYRWVKGKIQNSALADTSNKIPGGGLCSTVSDLAKLAIAMQSDRLVKPETRKEMYQPATLENGRPIRYGYGWNIRTHQGRKEVGHSGGQQRVTTWLYMVPETKGAIVLMSNREGAKLLTLARTIYERAHKAEE